MIMTDTKEVSRNEPCPCGSRKKYKRCHGVNAAPILGTPSNQPTMEQLTSRLKESSPGFDPTKMDPKAMAEMAASFKKLPKAQLIKMQNLMQKAMSGADITDEAQQFEKSLPPGFQEMMMGQMSAMGATMDDAHISSGTPAMNEEEARQIIESAKATGKISSDEADKILDPKKKSILGWGWLKK